VPDRRVFALESKLSKAWLAIWHAAQEAESLADQSTANDLYDIAVEISRIQQASVEDRRPRR
jgi:hypothetical protein